MAAARPVSSQVQSPSSKPPVGVRACATGSSSGPDPAINFDVFVAADADLDVLFPYALRDQAMPNTTEALDDAQWPPYVDVDLRTVVNERKVLWVQCENLLDDAFEALGDALGLPRPEPIRSSRGRYFVPDRLVTVLYFNPEEATLLTRFPASFRNALADASNPAALGDAWASALRDQRLKQTAAAKSAGLTGREDPPLELGQLAPFLGKLATDLVELARVARATNRDLYLHSLPD